MGKTAVIRHEISKEIRIRSISYGVSGKQSASKSSQRSVYNATAVKSEMLPICMIHVSVLAVRILILIHV